jgi:hypothetical protein
LLNKFKLESDLKRIFDDLSDKSTADRMEEIGEAIASYLGDASVGTYPSGTGSSVQFPGKSLLAPMLKAFAPPASAVSGPMFETALAAAVTAACSVSLGNLNGVPISPGTAIVTEIGLPPVVPVITTGIFTNNKQTSADAAAAIAAAIHQTVSSIIFNLVELVPSPAGPVPTPMPPVKIA